MSERPRFRLLGPLEVRDQIGAAIDLGGGRPRELLAYLLLHPRQAVTRDRLVATLWGDAASEGAATTLRTHVHAVRRVLARAGVPDALETRPGAYLLALEPEQIDVEVFEGLVHRGQEVLALGDAEESSKLFGDALSLWRDEPLSDLGPPDFARPTLTRCGELWLVAQEGQAAAQLALGRHRQVVGRLQELVEKHPFREELCALLMMALFRSGRQADALAAYAGARTRLADELGLDPGPRLRDLESAMLRQDPGLLPELPKTGIDVGEVPGAPAEDAVYAALRREAMVARETELALLDEMWRAASTGRAGVVAIAGPAGVGKSRLVAELAHRAAADRATVLVGRCDDPTPGAALVSAFSSSPRVRTVLDAAPDVVRRLLGSIVSTGTEAVGEATDPQALHRAAEWLLAALLSGGPVLLAIEDAERLDEPASEMLRHLVVRARGSLLVIVCFRDPPGSRHQPLLDLLGDGSIHGIARRIVLPPLDRAGVAAMIETHTGAPPADDVVAELATRTAGNPFFLHELLRDLDEQDVLAGRLSAKVPEGVRDVLRRRMRSLPEPTRAAVAGAAVLGRDVELIRLQHLLDEPEEQVVLALEAAVVAGFLVESGHSWAGGFAFPHELMREAVHDEIPVHRRQRLHLRAMDLLLADGASEADAIAAADHAWNAGAAADPAETADLLDRAARQAAASYGYEEAIRFAENRLTLARRTAPTDVQAGVAVDVARMRLRAGRGYERVLELFDDALAQYLAVGDTESAGAVHSRIGGTLALPRRGMDVTRSLDHFAAAEQLLAAPRDAFHLQRGRMSAAMHSLDSDLLADAADRCAAMAAELGRPDLASAAGWGHAWHAINGGRPAAGLARLEQAWSDVQGLGSPLLGWPLANAAALICTAYLQDPEGGRAWCRRGLVQPRFDTLAHPHDAIVDQLVLALAESGQVDPARRASERLPESSVGRRLVTFVAGDREAAAAAWEVALAEDRLAGDHHDAGLNARWLAEALLSLGREGPAVRVMHEALDGMSDGRQVPLEVWFRARLAQLPSTGLAEARSHLARCEEATVQSEEWRGLYGEVLLARAVVRARSDDPSAAGAALDAALDTFATYRLPRRVSAAQALQRSLNIDRGQSAHEHD